MNGQLNRINLYGLLAIICLSLNCAYFKPEPDLSSSTMTVNYISQKVSENFKNLNSLRGQGKIISNSPDMNFTASANISLKMPDKLLLKLHSGFGVNVASLLIKKREFTLFSPTENLVYYGDLDSVNLDKYFTLNLDFSNLANLLSGLTTIRNSGAASLFIDNKRYVIHIIDDQMQYKYWIDPKKFVVIDYQVLNDAGEKLNEYNFKHFRRENKVHFPTLIKITNYVTRQQLTLLYEDFETNNKISDSDFNIKLPENVKIKYL